MKKYFLVCCLLLFVCACQHSTNKQQTFFYQGVDSYGRTITLKKEPQRIVSLSSSITEIAFLLDCGDKLVGISDFCDYPEETKAIPKVGKLLNINTESILNVNPDLILISSIISKDDVEKLEKTGTPLFALKEENSISDLFAVIHTMGDILHCPEKATELVQQYQQEIDSLHYDTIQNKHTIYYVVGFGETGDYTAPGNSYINDIISLAGGENIAKDLTLWGISREELFKQNPDFIFIRKEDKESFCNTYPYTLLDAVKQGRVFPIESGWIDVLGPRNIEAIKYIHQIIHQP